MVVTRSRTRVAVVATILSVAVCPTPASAQEWGIFRKTTVLTRSLPPVVDLSGSRIAITVTAAAVPRSTTVVQSLRAKLVPLLFSDRTLSENAQTPDRIVEITLTEFSATVTTDRQDRSRTAAGTIKAAYRAIDARSKQSIDARNLGLDYERQFPPASTNTRTNRGGGVAEMIGRLAAGALGGANASQDEPPTVPELTSHLVDALAVQVAQRLVLTEESIEVPLPRGDTLDRITNLGREGRWGAMLEQLEQMPPLTGEADAFRLYAIGVANEAMAYGEDNAGAKRDLIANASQQFRAALKLRPNDGILRGAESRIAQSLAAFDTLTALRAGDGGGGSGRDAGGNTDSTRWDNAAIIELVKAGFMDAELIDAIRAARSPSFQLDSPQDLLRLRQGGVSDAVIRAMRERMAGAGR